MLSRKVNFRPYPRIIGLLLLLNLGACSGAMQIPTPQNTATAVIPSPTFTLTPFPTDTSTPAPTMTPAPRYIYATSITEDMSVVTLSDIQNHHIAEWARRRYLCNSSIALYPSHITFETQGWETDAMLLRAVALETKGGVVWHNAAKNWRMCALLKINPAQFGLEGKNDVYDVVAVMEDKNRTLAFVQVIISGRGIEYVRKHVWGEALITTGRHWGWALMDDMDYINRDELLISGKPDGPDDARWLANGNNFYQAQGTSREEIQNLFTRVDATDFFSPEDLNFLETHIFLGSPDWGFGGGD